MASLASLGSASSWVELRENGVEALRLQVETEVSMVWFMHVSGHLRTNINPTLPTTH